MLYLRKEYFSLLGGTYNGSCILQGYVDEKRLKTPVLEGRYLFLVRYLQGFFSQLFVKIKIKKNMGRDFFRVGHR